MIPEHPRWMNEYDAVMLDKPSVVEERHCAACGRPATDAHHVIEKGMGGVSASLEKRIPKVRLCGMGNASGCHGDVHAHLLHIYWDSRTGDWVMYRTPEPRADMECWLEHMDEYTVLPGWYLQKIWGKAIGGRA